MKVFRKFSRLTPDAMGAWLRIALACPSENAKNSSEACYTCPGCSNIRVGRLASNLAAAANNTNGTAPKRYNAKDWLDHVIGCAAIPGGCVTKRHNALCALLVEMLKAAGYLNIKLEPRTLAIYDCPCGIGGMPHDQYVEHRNAGCQSAVAKPRRHGPDIYFTKDGANFALDVRVCNELAATHRGKPIDQVFAEAAAEKDKHYGELCAGANAKLITIAVSALGALSDNTKALLKNIAKDTPDVEYSALCSQFSARAAIGSAEALLTAEGYAGVRPTPRAVSIATLQLLESTHGFKILQQLDPKKQREMLEQSRPAPPTANELNSIAARLDKLLDVVQNVFPKDIVKKAAEIKRQEIDAEQRALEEENPLHAAAPKTVARLSADGTDRATSSFEKEHHRLMMRAASAPPELDDFTFEALNARVYQAQNEIGHVQLLSADALARTEKATKDLANFLATANSDLTDTREMIEETAADIERKNRIVDDYVNVLRSLSTVREASVAKFDEKMNQANDLDLHTDETLKKLEKATSKLADIRRSASASSARNSESIKRAESEVQTAARDFDQAMEQMSNLQRDLKVSVTHNERKVQEVLARASMSHERSDVAVLGPSSAAFAPQQRQQQQQHHHHQQQQQQQLWNQKNQQRTNFAHQNPNFFSSECVSSSSFSSIQQHNHLHLTYETTSPQIGSPDPHGDNYFMERRYNNNIGRSNGGASGVARRN